jgi:hypothetical protein
MHHLSFLTWAVFLLAATPAPGQVTIVADTAGAAVVGRVYDAARDAPLVGARVYLVATARAAVTDGDGRFRLDVPAGWAHELAFEHPALDALGVRSPRRLVMLEAGQEAEVELRLPVSPRAAAIAELCPAPDSPGGMLGGVVLDPENDVPLPGVHVTISWPGSGPGAAGVERTITVSTAADGTYLACGLPVGEPLQLRARFLGQGGEARMSLTVSPEGLALRDVSLRPAPGLAPASLAGVVRDFDTDAPIAAALVRLPELGRQTSTDAAGGFVLADLDRGHHDLVIEHLAYGSRSHRVEVTDEPGRVVQIRLPADAIALGTIEVIVASAAEEHRRRVGSSVRLVTRADIADRVTARHVGDLIQGRWPGVIVRTTGQGVCVMSLRGMSRNACVPVFVDGIRDFEGGLYLLDLPPEQIESVEFIPALRAGWRYGTVGTGGVLEVWTLGNGPFAERRRR